MGVDGVQGFFFRQPFQLMILPGFCLNKKIKGIGLFNWFAILTAVE